MEPSAPGMVGREGVLVEVCFAWLVWDWSGSLVETSFPTESQRWGPSSKDDGVRQAPARHPTGELVQRTWTSLIASKHSKLVTTAASKQAPQRYGTLTRRID